jgi:glycosyltransferase involved in cell wall biosynthesis
VSVLRKQKEAISDAFRMQYNYGLFGRFINMFKQWGVDSSREMISAAEDPQAALTGEDSDKYEFNDNPCQSFFISEDTNAAWEEYPKISIVTPNLNQGRYLDKCLRSVIQQNYPNLEFIIIDGGSKDNSLEIIKKYENKIAHWEREENCGQAHAISKGLKCATGDIFNWLNPSSQLAANALFRCAETYRENPNAVGWIGAGRNIDLTDNCVRAIFPNGLDRENLRYNWNGGQFCQASAFLSTPTAKNIGGINPDLPISFGLDLWIRLLARGEFLAGKGIWSTTVIQNDPEAGESKENSSPEIIRIKRNYGFSDDVKGWKKKGYKTDELNYALPSYLKIRLERIKDFYKVNKHMFSNPPTLTFISNCLPRFNQTSADFRLFNILKILLENGCKINYLYFRKNWNDVRFAKTLQGEIAFKHLLLDRQDWNTIIAANNPDYVWITNLWGIHYLKFSTQLAKKLKENESPLKLIVDTIDFHFKEFHRKYELTKNPDDLRRANEFLVNEKVLYWTADTVVVISKEEKRDIQNMIPGIRKIEIIPNIHEILYPVRPYTKRKHMCFVGHFGNKHNVDTVVYFIKKIFQFILEKNPKVEFHVLGYGAEKYKKSFKSPNVKVIGSLKYLEKALTYYKLFICPMTYGAGMKGKIGGAVAAGVPIVTTSVGAEGFPFRDGEECFIADSPLEFAEKCNQCLNDPVSWHNFSVKSRLIIAENFSPGVVAEKLGEVLMN